MDGTVLEGSTCMQIKVLLYYKIAHSKAAPYQPNDATISPLLKEVHGLATLDDFAVESPFNQNIINCTFFQIHPNNFTVSKHFDMHACTCLMKSLLNQELPTS